MTGWRPDDWKLCPVDHCQGIDDAILNEKLKTAYEAGADAMLEKLRIQSVINKTNRIITTALPVSENTIKLAFKYNHKGKYVFISDDEE